MLPTLSSNPKTTPEKKVKKQNTKTMKNTKNTPKVQAVFNEGHQIIEMEVDANEEGMFDPHSGVSADEATETETTSDEDSDSDSQSEDGKICDNESQSDSENAHEELMTERVTDQVETQKKLDEIDQEMQQKILDLHDRMEESGLHGAEHLIEKLFDNKPGEDKRNKQKLKKKI